MAKYIIIENDARVLAQLYVFFKKRKPELEFKLVKCNYNHNCDEKEAEKYEKEQLIKFIVEELHRQKLDAAEGAEEKLEKKIKVITTMEKLLAMDTISDIEVDDILIMDITLFDSQDEQDRNSFADYASVRYADQLIEQKEMSAKNVRFYTKSTIKSDPRVFSQQTNGKWYVPVLRPNNFNMPGGEEERDIFAKKILMEE